MVGARFARARAHAVVLVVLFLHEAEQLLLLVADLLRGLQRGPQTTILHLVSLTPASRPDRVRLGTDPECAQERRDRRASLGRSIVTRLDTSLACSRRTREVTCNAACADSSAAYRSLLARPTDAK